MTEKEIREDLERCSGVDLCLLITQLDWRDDLKEQDKLTLKIAKELLNN